MDECSPCQLASVPAEFGQLTALQRLDLHGRGLHSSTFQLNLSRF